MKQPSHDTVATHPPRLYLLPSLERPRRTLSPRIGYAVAALVVGLGLFASVTPVAALSHLQRPLALLAADVDADLRDLCLRRAGVVVARRRRLRRRRAAGRSCS
jgi:hypothetical protein